ETFSGQLYKTRGGGPSCRPISGRDRVNPDLASRRLVDTGGTPRATVARNENDNNASKQGSVMSDQYHGTEAYHADVKQLHSMGYAQELSRRMGAFQNFAISFSIICILAGGITAFPLSLSAAGGASLGFGWPLACLFALIVSTSLGQVASAYPTAGGIYHWSSM